MNPRTAIFFLVAVVGGVGAAYGVMQFTQKPKTATIVVAKARVSRYLVIKDAAMAGQLFDIQQVPLTELPPKAITDPSQIVGRSTGKATIDAGKPLTEDDLAPPGETFASRISRGCRADSLSVTADRVVGGLVEPESRVDIMQTTKPKDENTKPKTTVVLQNVRVLAVDLNTAPSADGKPSSVPQTVTMEFKPEDALRFEEAKVSGSPMSLALRPPGDDTTVEGLSKTDNENKNKQVQRTPLTTPSDRHVLLIMNGAKWIKATYVTKDGQIMMLPPEEGGAETAPRPQPKSESPSGNETQYMPQPGMKTITPVINNYPNVLQGNTTMPSKG